MDANPSITFSIDTADLMDLPTPLPQVAGSTRALLQTLPSAPAETMQTARVLLRIHQPNEEASLYNVLYIAMAGGIVSVLLLIVLAVMALVHHCKNNGMTSISQSELYDND